MVALWLLARWDEKVVAAWMRVRFGVSASYVSKMKARMHRLGDATPGPQHNHVPPRLAPVAEALHAQVKADSDATLRELREWVEQQHDVRVSHPALWTVVARLSLTLEKISPRRRPDRAGVPDIA